MSSIKSRVTIFVCLFGLTLLVLSQAAELPKAAQSSGASPPSQVSPPPTDDSDEQDVEQDVEQDADQEADQNEDEGDEDQGDEDQGDDSEGDEEYEYYYEDEEEGYDDDDDDDDEADDNGDDEEYEDEESTPEEDLSWLAEQHYMVRTDCDNMNQTLSESDETDSELEQAYQDCKSQLENIETDMQQLVSQITGSADE